MDKYNNSHCVDLTAAIAISRADRKPCVSKRTYEALQGLTYKIGEVVILKYIDGMVRIWQRNGQDRYITQGHGQRLGSIS